MRDGDRDRLGPDPGRRAAPVVRRLTGIRRARVFAGVVLACAVVAPAGWVVSDRLEEDNDFCNACHLSPQQRLHTDIRSDFDAAVPASLAAAHAIAGAEHRPDGAFRCIDCHGGHGFAGRLRVKALAAKDAFWYAVGRFEEPTDMSWPLWDEDCGKCHPTFDENEGPDWESPRFHQLPVHNADLGVDCVACHLVHEAGSDPAAYHVHPAHVRSQCGRCHAEFQEGAS